MARSAGELRALVGAANQLVAEAQHFVKQAEERFNEAATAYSNVSDKLDSQYPASISARQAAESASIAWTQGIQATAHADAYSVTL